MSRVLFLAAPLALLFVLPSEAEAQFGTQCQRTQQSAGQEAARSIMGGFARGALGRMGGRAASIIPFTQMLSDALINLLDCDEQEKASDATDEAIRGGEVGSTATWQSESRPGVTGTSTVTAVEGDCMTVTDVVIVDGEETTAPKRMCRRPPSNRYVRV